MKTLIYSILSIFIFTISTSHANKPIVVGGELDYPPYSFLNEDGHPTGFQTELCQSIAKVMGMDIVIQLTSWAEVRKGLEGGSVDLISGMFYSDERAKLYDFSPPYSIVSSVIFARKDSLPVESIRDLKDKEIIVMRGEAMHDYVVKQKLTHRLLLGETPGDVLQKLASGQGDYALGAQMPGLYWINKLGLSNVTTMGKPLKPFKNCFSVKKGNTLLISRFTEGLMILYQTGEYQKLYEKWFGVLGKDEILLTDILKYSAMILIPLLCLLAMVFIWSWTLKQTVTRSTKELIDSRKQLQTLSDNLPGGYVYQIVLEKDDRYFNYISAGVEKVHGISVNDVMKDPSVLYQQVLEEDINSLMEQEFNSRTELTKFYAEVRYQKPSGEIRWLLLSSSPRKLSDQSVVSDGVAIDITPRKKAFEDLRLSMQRLISAQKIAKLGDFSWDIQSGEISWSDGLYNLLGYDKNEPIDYEKINEKIHHPDDLELITQWLKESINSDSRELRSNEYRLIRKDGQIIYVHTTGIIERTNDGNVKLFATLQDITERKQFENELINEKERLIVTLRSIGDGVITTDINGNIALINKVGEELTGWPQDEAEGKHIKDVFYIINEQTRQICENPIDKVLKTGRRAEIANNTLLRSRDGTERMIADSGAPIQSHDGLIIGVVLVFRDVTQQKRLEAEIQRSQKIESIGLLAGGIAHDFNNVLSVISGNVSYALSIIDQNDEARHALDDVLTGTKQAQQLTQQLLTFSKGGIPIKNVADIQQILKETAIFVARGSNVGCDFVFSDDLWVVSVDTGQINQAISNLIINAIQAMPEAGIIQIKAENMIIESDDNSMLLSRGNYVKISIHDNGAGIPKQHISNIFDPYFTTKQKGSGLGLATTYSIIKNHHGSITVESTPGKGTTFYIYLPATDAKNNTKDINTSIHHEGHGKILVMDDQEMILTMVKRLLRRMGYDTVVAKEGQQAIDIYQKAFQLGEPFSLVILDLTVPGAMGGAETMEKLLQIDPDVKAIVSSGYSNNPIMGNYEDYGFCGVISKPYTKKELAEALESNVPPFSSNNAIIKM